MADITFVDEVRTPTRRGTPFSADGVRNYTRVFHVKTTNRRLGAGQIVLANGIPRPYDPYSTNDGEEWDLAALCVGLDAQEKEDGERGHWLVTARYSTAMPEGGPSYFTFPGSVAFGAQNNPELEPPHIEYDFETVHRPLQKDLDGQAFLNSALQPFSPPPVFETARAVLVLTRNEVDFSRVRATDYAYAVNSDTFLGAPPGTVRANPPRAVLSFRGSISYWRVTWRLVFNSQKPPEASNVSFGAVAGAAAAAVKAAREGDELQSWQPEILDAGVCELQKVLGIPFSNQPVPIIRHGHAVTQPVLLDGEGSPAIPNEETGIIPPTFIPFKVYRARPFNKIFTRLGDIR